MGLFEDIEMAVDLFHRVKGALGGGSLGGRDHAGAAIAHFEEWTSADADLKQSYADAGTFRSQVQRLFALATSAELEAFETIARNVVSTCLTNRYYRPADYLSDVVDALLSRTFLVPAEHGEGPLSELPPERRRDKIDHVARAWLSAVKVGCLEDMVAAYGRAIGRALPYAALNRFERQGARLVSLVEESEVQAMARAITAFVAAWPESPRIKARFGEPAAGVQAVVSCLEGQLEGAEGEGLRSRMGWPLRLANAVPEDRQFLIAAALARLGMEPAPAPAPAAPAPGPGKRAAKAAAMKPKEEEEDASGPLRLLLSCPKCGAAFTADDETVSVQCEYCSSLLVLSASEREEIYVDDDRFQGADDVLDTVIQYRVQAHRAELIAEYRRKQEDQEAIPPESWMRGRLQAFEERLRGASRVLRGERLFAPYWHLTGLVAQGTVGRRRDGPKDIRVRGWGVEHTVPAYEPPLDLRDRGLRLAHARVRPLTVEQARQAPLYLPWVEVPASAHREVDKWKGQHLEPGFEAVVKHGEILFRRRIVAYRPYWLVELALGPETRWVLADAVFRTIAGYPETDEVRALLGARIADPLRSHEASFRRVQVIPSRCPDCGHEQHLSPRDHVTVCPNCHLGLEATPAGIAVLGYDHATVDGELPDGDYLPFWRFAFRLRLADGTVVSDLPGFRRALFGDGGPAGWIPSGNALWIPAFRLLGSEPGDETFRRLAESLHMRRTEVVGGKIPLGVAKVKPWGASVSSAEAAQLGRMTLMALHGTASAAQLNTRIFKLAIANPELALTDPRLTLLPFDRQGADLSLGGLVRVPRLLVEGGPELEALRVSVHRVRMG